MTKSISSLSWAERTLRPSGGLAGLTALGAALFALPVLVARPAGGGGLADRFGRESIAYAERVSAWVPRRGRRGRSKALAMPR